MYLPSVDARYCEQASISLFNDQRDRWFKPGGLLYCNKNEQLKTDTLVIRTVKMCCAVEAGGLFRYDLRLTCLGDEQEPSQSATDSLFE